mgnify:CR=1 FL=1
MSVWKDSEVLKRFPNYRGILDNTRIARYLIAKSLACDFDPNDSIENLEKLLEEKSLEFKEIVQKFTTQLGDKVIELEQSVSNKNYTQIADAAYWIKASAGSVGFDVFTRPSSDLEKYAREQHQQNVEQIVRVIKQLSERITELEAS